MFSEQRQSMIIDLIRSNGSVSLGELIASFGVSEATVRRDLSELEKRGLLKRTHGGAMSSSDSVFERDYREEAVVNTEEKKSIARVVASLVNDGDSVLLDSGTTTEQIATLLAGRNITIITNSATIPPDISDFIPEVYKAGGLYRSWTKSIVGPEAERFIRSLHPDKAFIATNGVNLNCVSTPHISEASIKQAMIDASRKKYLVADHTKFGKEYLMMFSKAEQFDGIITDDKLDGETVEYYRSRSIPVITENNYHRGDAFTSD